MQTTRPLEQLDGVDRTVATGTRDGKPTKAVTLTQTYPVPLEDLWDACTEGERIARWLMPIRGDLRVGGRYQLEGNAGGLIEECVPHERIAVTWEFGGGVSWVVATFTAAEEGATLHVEHIAHVDEELWPRFGPGAVGIGWDMMLLGLALHLVPGGASITPDRAMEWQMSPEGVVFMERSVAAWCDAQVAGGEDPAAARAAADRCLAAYTGSAG